MAGKSDSKAQKKLPKRANSDHPKHKKRIMWCARQDDRKDAREAAQLLAFRRNEERRARGEKTPWELAKERRYAKRH